MLFCPLQPPQTQKQIRDVTKYFIQNKQIMCSKQIWIHIWLLVVLFKNKVKTRDVHQEWDATGCTEKSFIHSFFCSNSGFHTIRCDAISILKATLWNFTIPTNLLLFITIYIHKAMIQYFTLNQLQYNKISVHKAMIQYLTIRLNLLGCELLFLSQRYHRIYYDKIQFLFFRQWFDI